MVILIEALVRHGEAGARRGHFDIVKRLGSLGARHGEFDFRNLDEGRHYGKRIVDFVKGLVPALECIAIASRNSRSHGGSTRGDKAALQQAAVVVEELDLIIVDGMDFHRGGNRREGLVPAPKLEVLRIALMGRVSRSSRGCILGNKGSLELGVVEVKELHHVLDIQDSLVLCRIV